MGVPLTGRAAAADAVEPISVVSSKASIPNAGTWLAVQYGYERFSIIDERGTEIGFAHRRKDARLIAAAPWLMDAAEDAVEALKLCRIALLHDRHAIAMIDTHLDELSTAMTKATDGDSGPLLGAK